MIYEPSVFAGAFEIVCNHWAYANKPLVAAVALLEKTWHSKMQNQRVIADIYNGLQDTKMDLSRFVRLEHNRSNPGVAAYFAIVQLHDDAEKLGKSQGYVWGDDSHQAYLRRSIIHSVEQFRSNR